MTTLRPLGPSVTLTALLSSSTPRSMRSRASVENLISLADMTFVQFDLERRDRRSGGLPVGRCGPLDDAHDVALLHDQEVLAINLHLGPGPFAEEDRVARLDVERNQLAAFVAGARADGDHLAFLRLFLRGVGNDDPAFGFEIAFRTSDDDAVVEGPELHWVLSAAGA